MLITEILATLLFLTSPGSAVNPDKSFMSTMIMLVLLSVPVYLEKKRKEMEEKDVSNEQ